MKINWNMNGMEVEQESFRQIETEMPTHNFTPEQWRVVRRMIHTTADFSIAPNIAFGNNPIRAGRQALRDGAPIFSDSNMIKAGISVYKMQKFNPTYTRDSIHCYVADPDIASIAKEKQITRSLAALEKARRVLDGGIVLVGNAPLALAGIVRMIQTDKLKPRLIIGMPVGFVHVVESKKMVTQTNIPYIVLNGRRGGSPLAVTALHGIMESGLS